MHVWALGLSCETPAAPPDRAAGARTRQPENSKRAHLSAQALQTPPNFHEKTPREGRKERKWEREREKKSAKFWALRLRAPTLRAPHAAVPDPSGPIPPGSTLRPHLPSSGGPPVRASTFSLFGPLRSSFLSCCSFVFLCIFNCF